MQCDFKKCKKCGMWWKVAITDEMGKTQDQEGCGHMFIYMKLDSIQRAINSSRAESQQGRQNALQTLRKIVG